MKLQFWVLSVLAKIKEGNNQPWSQSFQPNSLNCVTLVSIMLATLVIRGHFRLLALFHKQL